MCEDKESHDKLFEKMLRTRTILLSTDVNPGSARRIIESLFLLESDDPSKDITLVLNSGGGDVSSGLAIYDVLRFIKPKVKMLSAGLTASIAAVILLASPKDLRCALPNSRFLIHQPLIPMTVFGPASDLEITAHEILKTREKINSIIANETGQPYEKVEKDTQRDFWMSAQEAVSYGLISRIVKARDEF